MKVLLIDDEEKNRSLLRKMLTLFCPEVEILGECDSAFQGLEEIRRLRPELIFLDIRMPGMDGFQMLEHLKVEQPEIVFVTAYEEYAIKAIRHAAFDYLLKPIEPDDLKKTAKRFQESRTDKQIEKRLEILESMLLSPTREIEKLVVSSQEGILILRVTDICLLEAKGPYTLLYTVENEQILSTKNLKEYEELLASAQFFRCHHSYLVNLSLVRKFLRHDQVILLETGRTVEVSKRKKDELLKRLADL